eukprot:1714512-Rhodomonas_salina.3
MVGEGYDVKCAGFLVAKELDAFGKVLDAPGNALSSACLVTLSASPVADTAYDDNSQARACHPRWRQGVGQDPAHQEPPPQGRQDDHRWRHGLHLPQGEHAFVLMMPA